MIAGMPVELYDERELTQHHIVTLVTLYSLISNVQAAPYICGFRRKSHKSNLFT